MLRRYRADTLNTLVVYALRLFSFSATSQAHNQLSRTLRSARSALPSGLRPVVLTVVVYAVVSGSQLVAKPAPARTPEDARALLSLSQQQNLHNHALALATARQALEIFQGANDQVGTATTYSYIGEYAFAQSDLPAAQKSYEEALRVWRSLNNSIGQARVLVLLGYLENRRGDWSSAFSFYAQAQNLVDETKEPFEMGRITNGIADIFEKTGALEISVERYKQALEYFRRATGEEDRNTLAALGNAYYLIGDYDKASATLQHALSMVSADSLYAAVCHERMAKVHLARNEHDAALEDLNSALPIYTRAGNQREAARVEGLLGQLYQAEGRVELAREKYFAALRSFERLADRINQSAIYFALGDLELARDDLDRAQRYLEQSIEITENTRRVPTTNDLSIAFSASVHERYQSLIDCLMRKHQRDPQGNFAGQALQTSEMARARTLAELLNNSQTNFFAGIDPRLAEREKLLRQTLRAKEEYKVTLLGVEHTKEALDALVKESAQLEAEYQEVTRNIKAENPASNQITRPVTWDLPQIQQRVLPDEETLLLEYSLGKRKSYLWVVTKQKFLSYELPPRPEIEALVRQLHQLLKQGNGAAAPAELNEDAQRLAQTILWPVVDEMQRRKRIIVIADGALNYIPFQMLPNPRGNNEPLITRYEIINAPSADRKSVV